MAWQSILDAATSARAEAAYEGIVAGVVAAPPGAVGPRLTALLLASHPRRDDDPQLAAEFEGALVQVVERLQRPTGSIGLYGGWTLEAWLVAQLGDDDLVANLRDYDAFLMLALSQAPGRYDHGISRGLAGAAIYALERWHRGDRPFAAACLELVVSQLRALAVYDDDGVAWITGYDEATDTFVPGSPSGWVNCGVLHGTPGVTSVLARIHETGTVATKDLVEASQRWLLHKLTPDATEVGRFPSKVVNGQAMPAPHSAWCVGDTGALAALWNASKRVGGDEGFLLNQARICAKRPLAEAHVVDGAMCHGGAGIAHIMNRYYQATGDEVFRAAARAWYEQVLATHRPELAYGGFGHVGYPAGAGRGVWEATPSLRDGAVGIALALQAAFSDEEPDWDRLFAMDAPATPKR